jgi:hypothetical protein
LTQFRAGHRSHTSFNVAELVTGVCMIMKMNYKYGKNKTGKCAKKSGPTLRNYSNIYLEKLIRSVPDLRMAST